MDRHRIEIEFESSTHEAELTLKFLTREWEIWTGSAYRSISKDEISLTPVVDTPTP